jgi:hypothetical protein
MSKTIRDLDKKLREAQFKDEVDIQQAASKARLTRARSFSVGCMSCGMVEIMMRGDEAHLWYVMSPEDMINTIHQFASSIGLTASLNKKNFLGNHATPAPEITIPKRAEESKLLEQDHGQVMATETPKQRRKSKRATASS